MECLKNYGWKLVTLYRRHDQNNPKEKEIQEGQKQKQRLVVDVSGHESKVQCSKEQYCTGTWNVRSMNQGKLDMVKQEMARVNIDILGISELTQTEMGGYNSDDHQMYYCGQGYFRRNRIALTVNKRI